MRPFKFRAEAALDLRRRDEQRAAVELARVQARFSEANDAVLAMERQRALAMDTQAAQAQHGIDAATMFWHRNWIVRLRASVDDLRTSARQCAGEVEAAERAWRLARQKSLALTRLRERAMTRYRTDERREELKSIDELARLRYTLPNPGRED